MIEFLTNRDFLILMAKMFSIFGGVMTALAYTTLMERRVMAFVQMRPGPNRVGPMGLLQRWPTD
jgi:NADH-quinone oxidoreductase subunit H